MDVRRGRGGGYCGDFVVGHLGLDPGGQVGADGGRVGEYLDRVGGAGDVGGQLGVVAEELAQLVGDGAGGQSGEDGADRAVEVQQQVAGAEMIAPRSLLLGAGAGHAGNS